MNQENVNLRYFAYVRKSSEDLEKQALSIPAQIDKVKELFPNLNIVDIISESKSAFIPNNRPEFNLMIDRIAKGEADGIIAWHPDRLSRNEKDAAEVTYMVRTGVIKDLKFGSYYFHNSPEGIMMLQLALSQSQYFSSKLGKDVKRGLGNKIKMGWRCGLPPAGYLNAHDEESGLNIIVKDVLRFPLVRKIWDLMLTGNYTPPKILEIVNNEWGYKSKKRKHSGDKSLSYSGIYRILTNPFYYGWFETLIGSGNWQKGEHAPMITRDEFDRVQILLGRVGKQRPITHEFAYTGIIRCGECDCLITAETKRRLLKNGNINDHTYYHCTYKKRELHCKQKPITLEDLELQIEREIEKYTILPEFKDWALEALNDNNDREIEDRSKIHEMQSKAVLDAQKELDSLTQMRYRELIDDNMFLKAKNELQQKIAQLKEQLRDVEGRAEKWIELTEKTFEFACYAHHKFLTGSLQEQKEVLLGLGTNFLLKDGTLTLEPNEMLVYIGENYPALEKEYLRLEPHKVPMNKEQNHALDVVHSRWLSGMVQMTPLGNHLESLVG